MTTTEEHKRHLLGIVVPCFNEEEILAETSRRLRDALDGMISAGKIDGDSKIYFIDDGSRDDTWRIIESLAAKYSNISGMKLSRNFGHQRAVLAGLMEVPGDVIISIDADLQDDVSAIEKMVDAYLDGHDVVYGVREDRSTDTLFKRLSAEFYYRLMRLIGVEAVFNHADYRLLSRRALNILSQYHEVNLFLRGVVPLIGLPSTKVFYARAKRFAGESKYPLRKMLTLALEGITSFSVVPLRLITLIGFLIFIGSVFLGGWALYVTFSKDVVPGWASTVVPIYFLGGVQLLCLGIIGEYLAKIYQEAKQRPRYSIEKML